MDFRTLPKPRSRWRTPRPSLPYLYLALEAGHPLQGSARFALDEVDAVVIGRGARRGVSHSDERGQRVLRIEVPDPWLSHEHSRIVRREGEYTLADVGSRNGTLLNDVAITHASLHDGDVIEVGGSFFLFRVAARAMGPDVVTAAQVDDLAEHPWSAVTRTVNTVLAHQLADLVRISATRVSIALHGPTGSGKELIARAVHAWSGRKGAFVAVNCGALPATLVESELFGYRRGAFSGALNDKLGLIAAADGGTLFLDEIGDLPVLVQPALLRALEERAVVPVGATTPQPVDFRVVSATHRNLTAMIEQGGFREDLWARLAGFPIDLPGLSARLEDLGTLVADLAERLAPGRGVALTTDAARALLQHDWPRNVRELEKLLASAIALCGDGMIDVIHLPESLLASQLAESNDGAEPAPGDPRRDELTAALEAHGGNISAAARALGKRRTQVQRWMRRWGLKGGEGRARRRYRLRTCRG